MIKTFYKKIGETPLQCLGRFRIEFPEFKDEKISYAGRLDPMAEGEMLFVIGDENKNRQKYLGLDKKYTFKILFGVSTDTGDVLGLVQDPSLSRKITAETSPNLGEEKLKNILDEFIGKQEQKYPWFSSKTVFGKPLFEWFRSGRSGDIERPSREIEIYSIKLLGLEEIRKEELKKYIEDKISLVDGDFRQNEILSGWRKFFGETNMANFQVAEIETKCSSGTYIRSLVEKIGDGLGVPALALHIKRDKIYTKV